MRYEVYLALGSNLGDRTANIAAGLRLLHQESRGMVVSSIYETQAEGFDIQPPFLNAVCRLWTALDPFQLMAKAREIEAATGRTRAFASAPRTLDIDILVHGRVVLESPAITLPHTRMAQRAFVLEPLAEIAPELRHPLIKETVRSLLVRLPRPRAVLERVLPAPWERACIRSGDTEAMRVPAPSAGGG